MDDPGKIPKTSSLLIKLARASSLQQFLTEHENDLSVPSFTEYLDSLCKERGVVREHVITKSGIERSFGHQLFRGARKPSRDNVIRLSFGLGLSLEETQQFLTVARKSELYPKIKRDAVILYAVTHHMTIIEVQTALMEQGLSLLGDEKYEHSDR